MHRKLTILFSFAFFVLLVVWAITPAQADTGTPCPHKKNTHPHCQAGSGNGNGSKEKTLVCHSDCFYWDGFYLEVKNLQAHLDHGDHPISQPEIQIWNDDYCCDDGTSWPYAYEKGCCADPVPDGKTCKRSSRSPTSE